MNVKEFTRDEDVEDILRKTILRAIVAIIALIVLGAFSFYFFNEQIQQFTSWTSEKFGFWGMATIVFLADTLITPFPPDLILVIVAKTDLQSNWILYVGILGSLSVLGGNIGGFFGRKIGRMQWAGRLARQVPEESWKLVHKLGFWAVVLGAATPLPFSITCWTAGFMGMKKRLIFLACLVRLPRYYIYYLLIVYSDFLGNSFSTL